MNNHIVVNEDLDTICGAGLTGGSWITLEDQKWDPEPDVCAECLEGYPEALLAEL